MTKVMKRAGDRMLGVLLKQDRAGACYWNAGASCTSCYGFESFCRNGYTYQRFARYVYDCDGLCGNVRVNCYDKKLGYGC
jgi:hypothetical protein